MRVADFSFDRLLYEGTSTLVYAGVRDPDGTPVVAKLVGHGRRNLTHEYLVLEKVAGPGVVEALGLFEGNVGPVLVQRRFGAGSLADALRGGRVPVPRALRIALQLAQVCARIHAARVIHRDIKPANILYDPHAEVIALGDFGIAAELPVNARALPVGDLVGTPAYVSPEHTGRTSQGCDARSDLYSLGVTLYELLTGELPFTERNLLETVAAHLSKVPAPPHHRVAAIPPVVSDLVMKLLAKLPGERYQSARGLAIDLERCLQSVLPDGTIARFELGRCDLLRPRFPARLFGRGLELAVLEQAYARAATGAPTLVLLSGREGSGRSALVRELVRAAAVTSPLALGGWRSANERPLSGLGDALGALAGALVRLDDERLAALRRQFAARLGPVGQVVIDLAPGLGDAFGPQPALAALAPAAAHARLHHAVCSFAAALGEAAPFVVALRGFEHADPASVSLLESVLNSPTASRTLIVLIAPDPAAFGKLRQRADAVSIALGPLPVAAVGEWAAATLACEPGRAAALGEVLHGKVAGNPLMLVRVVEHLVETGVIERRDGRYTWSLDAVRATPAPPTLGGMAALRIADLDGETRRALIAIACCEDATPSAALAAMLAEGAELAGRRLAVLEREGLVVATPDGHRAAHDVIAQTALAAAAPAELARMRGRLGLHLLAALGPSPAGDVVVRAAMMLSRGTPGFDDATRVAAAALYVAAGEQVMASVAYEAAAAWYVAAGALLDDTAWRTHPDLKFRIELGRARSLMMLGRNTEADDQLQRIIGRDLSIAEIGVTYAASSENHAMVRDRARALEVGLAGLDRLGIVLPREPSRLRPLAAIRLIQRHLSKLTTDDHLRRPDATDARAVAAVRILSTLTAPAMLSRRLGLYVMITETALGLILEHGHVRNAPGLLALHACFLHAMRGDHAAARTIYEAAEALEAARSAPELVARTAVVFYYMVSPWFGPWQDAATRLARAIRQGAEVGDPVFAALCASAMVTMLSLTGAPLDRMVVAVEGWGPYLRGDPGVAANAANIVNIAGKLSRGEPITLADLDRVTDVPRTAGPMRNNAMVNLGLALAVAGHEAQVRAWLDDIRDSFPEVNFAQPHRMTLWLLDGLFAAKDARAGRLDRRAEAETILETLRVLRRETRSAANDPAIALIEGELARADGELDRAAGLYGRAARLARASELWPVVGYAHEARAQMLEAAGYADEATMFYREAVVGYRRWGHLTKALALEREHPAVRGRERGPGDRRFARSRGSAPPPMLATFGATATLAATRTAGPGNNLNDQLDLATVLKVSQEISTQLHGAGIVRAVLTGIAQNAGAERVVFVMRTPRGGERVYGELHAGIYRDVDLAIDDYPALPRQVLRVVRRTGRPLVVADATSDPSYAGDPFVVASHGRSIAVVPVRRQGEVMGFVVLENRMVAGAFTPQLVSLAQALVTQAVISLDTAALYRDLEDRVTERTAALRTRNASQVDPTLAGLSALAARCHALEAALAVEGRPMTGDERGQLAVAFQALRGELSRLPDVGDGVVQIRKAELDAVLGLLRSEGHPIAHDVELWGLESMRARFQRIAEQARVLALRLGKDPIRVQIEHNGVYVDRDAWAPFWSAFVHVVGNAIDHGLEAPGERAARGKGIATLTLRSYLRAGALVVELADDGRGIAWDPIADRARAAGLAAETREDLAAALFASGAGLAALAEVCRTIGCEIVVDSARGQGTTLRFEASGQLARARRDRAGSREPLKIAADRPMREA